MTDKQGRGVPSVDKANGRARQACPKYPRDGGDSFEVQLRIRAGDRCEEVFRHEEIGRECVGDPLGRHLVQRSPFIDPANERLASMISPMADFVGE